MTRIGVIGGGAWGLALAQLCATKGLSTGVWMRSDDGAAGVAAGESAALPGVALDPRLRASTEMAILRDAEIVLSVIPAQAAGAVLAAAAGHLDPGATVVLCQKGVERGTLALPHEVARAALPDHALAILTGPSFAHDVARGLPTAVTVAAEDMAEALALRDALATPTFRPYPSDDPVGAQIGGAVKNVMAIACGIIVARELGESARAALVARGFAEMNRLAMAMGGRAETVAGLSGLGDLALTCASAQSRNFSLGLALGRGEDLAGGTYEGAASARSVVALAAREGIEMPIAETVAAIVEEELTVAEAVENLLQRPLRGEE